MNSNIFGTPEEPDFDRSHYQANFERHPFENSLSDALASAGITLDGPSPCDPHINDTRVFSKVLRQGSLGLGEAYMDGWWDCGALDECVAKALRAGINPGNGITGLWQAIKARLVNMQSRHRAGIVGEQHYDLGNDLFERMLDCRLTYTCGYWRGATSLDEAQRQKHDLVCRKLGLAEGDRVLDIGCGWGSFARYAAANYGARVTGITISRQQARDAAERCKGLPVDIRLQDYRDINDKFDHVVSLGMFEHVGPRNYHTYMRAVHRLLDDHGLFVLHTIGSNSSSGGSDPWLEKYIFPNGVLPSIAQVGAAIDGLFVMEDWHNFGDDYDRTLMNWYANFSASWPDIASRYGPRFYRMWRYYLLTCAGSFRARKNQLWQIVLSKSGVPGGYSRPSQEAVIQPD